MSEVETQVLEESGMSSTAGVGSEVPSENSMVTPMATEGQTSAFNSGTDPNLSYGYAQGYSTQANYEIPNNYEENVNYGDYYNYYSNYYQHLQVKGQHYIDPSQTQSAIDSKANTRDLINKALARHQSKADAARDEEEDEEGQIPASPRAFNRTPSSTRGGSAHNSRYSRSRSISRSRSVSKERQLRSRSRSLSPKRYISRSRSRSPRRRHHSRSRSRSPYRGPIIKDYRRGRRGFVRYPRGFRDRGSRPFRRGHSGYTLGYFGHSRRREYSHSRSRSISPKRRYIEIDKIDNSDEERTVDSKNSETLKPSDIKMSEKALTKSFLAMLEEKQKRAKMIPIVAKSETSERDDRRHGFVNTFNSVAGRQSNSDKHTLSYDLESEGWQVVDDANTDSKTVDRSGNEDEDYKEEIIEEFEAEEDQKSVKKSELKSDSSEEESKSKKKKSKKQKKHKKRKASTSDTSDSDSDNDNTEENEKKRSKKKKKKSKKRKRKDSSSSSSSDDEEKVKKHKKKKKKKKESSSESESEDKKEDNEEITKDQEMKESDANDRVIVETKDLSKTKEKKKKHNSDSSDSDSNKKKKKKKSKKKSSKKRKRRSSSSSSSYSSDSSDSDSKKKKKKKSKKSKSKKHKKKNKDKSKSINDDKKKVKQETTDKDESEIVIVMSVGDPPLQLKWPKKLIKQTHCMPSLEYSINPKVTINQEDFKEIKIRTNSFESNSFKTSGKLVSEYEKFIDELNPNIQCEDPTHEYDSLEHKLRDKLVKNMSERNERQDVMTSSERRALEKLKKQSFHSYNYEDNYRRHDDLKSAPMSAYYSAKVPKSSPLKSNDETETKSNKSNENEIKSSETISLSIEDHSHKHQSFQSEVNKVDDKKLTAQELLERVKQRRHSSKDNKETNNEKERRDLKSKNLPHIGKMKGLNKKKKGSITTANADSTQSSFVSQPMALDMNYDYTWYYNYYMNSVYGVAQYPQVYDPSLASAYYAYYQMVTSNDYSQSDLNEWAKQNGLTITSNVDTNQSDTNLQNKEIELDKDKQQTGVTQTTTDPSAVENKTEYESQENGSTNERKVEQMSDVTTETKQNIENKNIEVLVSIKPSEIPHEESEESKPSPTNTSPFSSTNFQQKVKVRVTASSHTETDSTETDAAPPPPPPPPRPLMTRLISSEPITLPNGQVLPAGTKQVVVRPYHTEDRNKFTTQWFVDAFNGQKTTEGNTQ